MLPARIETQTELTLKMTREAADELGVPVRLHAAQGLFEVGEIVARTGLRPIPYLESIGFLGEKTFIPHAWTVPGHRHMPESFGEGDDVGILAEHGTTVIFCPIPTAHYGVCLEDFDAYRAKGVRVVLGTDSAPPNMIRAMDLAMGMTKAGTGERTSAQAEDLYRAATLDPAERAGPGGPGPAGRRRAGGLLRARPGRNPHRAARGPGPHAGDELRRPGHHPGGGGRADGRGGARRS